MSSAFKLRIQKYVGQFACQASCHHPCAKAKDIGVIMQSGMANGKHVGSNNGTNTAAIGCIQGQIAQLMGLTKLVVPNTSVCPGWGNVTITAGGTTGA